MSVGGGATGAATIHAATHKVGTRGDEMLMRQTLINVLDNRGANSGLPPYLLRYLWLYKTTRDDWLDGPPRPPSRVALSPYFEPFAEEWVREAP